MAGMACACSRSRPSEVPSAACLLSIMAWLSVAATRGALPLWPEYQAAEYAEDLSLLHISRQVLGEDADELAYAEIRSKMEAKQVTTLRGASLKMDVRTVKQLGCHFVKFFLKCEAPPNDPGKAIDRTTQKLKDMMAQAKKVHMKVQYFLPTDYDVSGGRPLPPRRCACPGLQRRGARAGFMHRGRRGAAHMRAVSTAGGPACAYCGTTARPQAPPRCPWQHPGCPGHLRRRDGSWNTRTPKHRSVSQSGGLWHVRNTDSTWCYLTKAGAGLGRVRAKTGNFHT